MLTGLLFAATYLCFGHSALLVKVLFLASIFIVISFIDLKYFIIPDKLIIFALFGGTVLNIFVCDLTLVSSLMGLISAAAPLLALAVVSRGGMGGGDIKLAAVIGLCLGWPNGLFAVIMGCLLAGLAGIALLLTRVKSRKDVIPFGPFLSGGALLTIFHGYEILNWYLEKVWL